jgi:hypothetical protein
MLRELIMDSALCNDSSEISIDINFESGFFGAMILV